MTTRTEPFENHSREGLGPENDGFSSGDPPSDHECFSPDVRTNSNKQAFRTNVFLIKIFRNVVRRFLRGFSRGVGFYAGVKIVLALVKNPLRESLGFVTRGIISKDCPRVATFFGLYPSIYHLVVEVLNEARSRKDGWTYGVAGGLAGLSVAILDRTRRQTLAFFSLSRAMGAGITTLVARGYLSAVPFFEVGAFCACGSLITYCFTLKPQCLDQGYYRSLRKSFRVHGSPSKFELLFRIPGPKFLTCEEGGYHPGPCVQHWLVDLVKNLPFYAKLNLPIHAIPILVFKRKALKERSLIKNLALSASFLGIMLFLAKVTLCIFRNLLHGPSPTNAFVPAMSGFISGLALLVERYSRRKQLTLFVVPQTITILYTAVKCTKLWPYIRIPHGFTLIFALSMMCVMHAYEREPESLTSLINGVLRFFIGSKTGTPAGQ